MGMHPDNWNAPMVLLGNKRDVIDEKPSERQVSKDDVKKTVKKWSNCKYAEITCKRATEGPGHYLFQLYEHPFCCFKVFFFSKKCSNENPPQSKHHHP